MQVISTINHAAATFEFLLVLTKHLHTVYAYVVIRDRFIQVHFSDTNNIKVTLKLQCPPILYLILQILACVTRTLLGTEASYEAVSAR